MIFAVSACLLVSHAAGGAVEWRDGVALEREGSTLMYDGQRFAAVGVNKHELLSQYIAGIRGASEEEAAKAREAAEKSLQVLADIGVQVIRVRVSGFWPAQIEDTYLSADEQTREAFWQGLDDMFADCDRYGIRVVATIAWHIGAWADLGHESLTDLYTDPLSESRRLLHQWIRDLVGRYRDRDTVLFWELTNEANLGADLRPQRPDEGVLGPKLERPAPHIVRGPVIRDGRNNYSSDELAALTRELARLIKSIDDEHLVGTGFSRPRRAAWHLWLGSIRRSEKMDWTEDTEQQQADYLQMITPEPVDIVSLHAYSPDLVRLLELKQAADSMDKPVYIGEFGIGSGDFAEPVYDSAEAVEALGIALEGVREIGAPLTLLWTWDEWGTPRHEPVIEPETQPEVLDILREANASAGEAADGELVEEERRARVEALDSELRAVIEEAAQGAEDG